MTLVNEEPVRVYRKRLFIKKLTDGGYSTETRRTGMIEIDPRWNEWAKSLKEKQLTDIKGECFLVISSGGCERLENDKEMVDYVELLPIKLPKHIREIVSGQTWNP